MSWTLCIDFGTAFSKAAAAPADAWARFAPASVRPLMLNPGEGNPFLLDSAVFVDEARVLFGPEAVARAAELAHGKRAALRSFKTLLSASDFDRALKTAPPRSIDPHGRFSMRDLIVLYLAYLSGAIECAAGLDPELRGPFALRCAAPAWRSGDGAGLHNHVVRLFVQARALQRAQGPALLAPGGLSLEAAHAAASAAQSASEPLEMGLIFEATAAAAYSSIGLATAAPHLLVVDMGAGTTDLAALAGAGAQIAEIPEARVTLKQAGDFVDGVIANIALEARRDLKSADARAACWRAIMRDMRGFKETLFADGRVAMRLGARVVTVTMRDLERDADFRSFAEALASAYAHSFAALYDHARADGAREVQTVAVGGGAAAPFVRDLIARRPRGAGGVKVTARPATPDWAHAPEFRGNLAPVFPQLAIAIGGALAPASMMAARGDGAR